MGLDYAYEMWVPEERLYDFLEAVNKYAFKGDGTILEWPDGKRLRFLGSDISRKSEEINEVALDCSFKESLCTSFYFESDEFLENNEADFLDLESGKYRIGCIYTNIDLEPTECSWLDNDLYQVRVRFTAATKGMSCSFRESSSIRRLFLDLALAGGANSCLLDCEGSDDRILFLDGHEMDEVVSAYSDIYDLRALVHSTKKSNANENRLRICQQENNELSHHELMARIEWAQYDPDSGIRAAACRSLLEINNREVEEVICKIAQKDSNWRVRYVATTCLSEINSSQSENSLFRCLYDENPQIQIAAVKTFGWKHNLNRNLADELEQFIAKLPFRGPTMGLFLTAMDALSFTWQTVGKPHHAQIIRQRMSEPDFPFQSEATQAIERLEVWSQRV